MKPHVWTVTPRQTAESGRVRRPAADTGHFLKKREETSTQDSLFPGQGTSGIGTWLNLQYSCGSVTAMCLWLLSTG